MKILKITILRAEGLIDECYETEHKTVEDADLRLVDISLTAPKYGGYDKTDVTSYFEDGSHMTCRHDVQFGNIDGTVIEHMKTYLLSIKKLAEEQYDPDEMLFAIRELRKIKEYNQSRPIY